MAKRGDGSPTSTVSIEVEGRSVVTVELGTENAERFLQGVRRQFDADHAPQVIKVAVDAEVVDGELPARVVGSLINDLNNESTRFTEGL